MQKSLQFPQAFVSIETPAVPAGEQREPDEKPAPVHGPSGQRARAGGQADLLEEQPDREQLPRGRARKADRGMRLGRQRGQGVLLYIHVQ